MQQRFHARPPCRSSCPSRTRALRICKIGKKEASVSLLSVYRAEINHALRETNLQITQIREQKTKLNHERVAREISTGMHSIVVAVHCQRRSLDCKKERSLRDDYQAPAGKLKSDRLSSIVKKVAEKLLQVVFLQAPQSAAICQNYIF